MNSILPDPDAKIYMSLDEIIQLSRGQKGNQLAGRNFKTTKRKKKYPRKGSGDHSVPLLSSEGGLDIYVTKQSPLLSAENRRRIAQGVENILVNSDLIQNTKEIIPAEYKLVKTGQGVERVLVPAKEYILRPQGRKLSQPRKLKKTSNSLNSDSPKNFPPSKPPPLVPASVFNQPPPLQTTAMDEPDIVIVDPPKYKKTFEVIDVEADMPGDLLTIRGPPWAAPLSVPRSCGQTLNERFTTLTGNLHT